MRISIAIALAGTLAACDLDQYALLNSLPVEGVGGGPDEVHVFLAVDGLDHRLFEAAQRRGALSSFSLSRSITMFPGTSDASWTRILRSDPLPGYELEHYDPAQDEVVGGGYLGLLEHALPKAAAPYLHAFDYHANGYLDGFWSYRYTELSLGESLDNLFYLLALRSAVEPVFFGYLIELDVVGHMASEQAALEGLLELDRRIERFRADNPNRRYVFTLLSDHGLDYVAAKDEEMIDFADELGRVGVRAVDSLAAGRSGEGVFAVPIVHTRVSYLALHTEAALAPEVARRSSSSVTVELAISASPAPAEAREDAEWYAVWQEGQRVLTFGYLAATDRYLVAPGGDPDRFGLPTPADRPIELEDQETFDRTVGRSFPDLLYRTRTALAPVGVQHPAEVLVSFRRPYASRGFEIPGGANEIASSGFHGGMHAQSSGAVVASEQRRLPDAVRADEVLDLFPELAEHIARRGVKVRSGVAGASL